MVIRRGDFEIFHKHNAVSHYSVDSNRGSNRFGDHNRSVCPSTRCDPISCCPKSRHAWGSMAAFCVDVLLVPTGSGVANLSTVVPLAQTGALEHTFFKLQGEASEIRFKITVDAFGVWQPIPQSSVLPQRLTEKSESSRANMLERMNSK